MSSSSDLNLQAWASLSHNYLRSGPNDLFTITSVVVVDHVDSQISTNWIKGIIDHWKRTEVK